MKLQKTDSELILTESGNINLVSAVIVLTLGVALIYLYFAGNGVIWMPIAGFLMLIAAAWIAFGAARRTTRLSKSNGCTYTVKKILKGTPNVTNFNLEDISSVDHSMKIQHNVAQNNYTGNNPNRQDKVIGTIEIVLKDGQKLAVGTKEERARTAVMATLGSIGAGAQNFGKPLSEEAKTIADFCGVKLNSVDKRYSDSLNDVVSAIKDGSKK